MKFIELENTVSTNEYLKKMPLPEEWTTVLAYTQSGGKGSKGREFVSPFGGAYFSFVFYPDRDILPKVTPLVAVAVREAILNFFGIDCKIKWVNDLYFNEKKVCGILTECRSAGERNAVVVGVGVNLYKPAEGFGKYSDIAGYLSEEKADKEKIKNFVFAVLDQLKITIKSDFMKLYAENSCVLDKKVIYTHGDFSAEAKVLSINSDGSITLDFGDRIDTVIVGEIKRTNSRLWE